MISHKYKCIFVHITKTGGTSIEKSLIGTTSTGGFNSKHMTAEMYRDRYLKLFSNYFKFSVIRNPWDKCFSHYCYRGQDKSQSGYKKTFRDINFLQWMQKVNKNQLVFKPQVDILADNNNYILDAAFLVGFCGGLTTFSKFMFDAVLMLEQKYYLKLFYYICMTILLSIVFYLLGPVP